MPFLGKQPTAGFASIVKDDLTADGSTTAFTLSKQVANANDIAVFVGNVRQEPTDAYSVSGTTLTMTAAPASGINFYVLHIAGTVESSVVPAAGTTVPGAFGVSGDFTVDTNTLIVDASANSVGIGATPDSNRDLHIKRTGANASILIEETSATNYGQFIELKDSATSWFIANRYANTGSGQSGFGIGTTNSGDMLQIDTSGRVTKPSQPLLQATGGPNIRAVTGTGTANTTVIYVHAGVNNGNHYNTSTGLFTCPVAGWYRVTQFMMVDTAGVTEALNVGLLKNGAVWLTSYTSNSSYNMNVSNGIVYCSVNDTLGVRVGHGGKHSGYDSFTVELIG